MSTMLLSQYAKEPVPPPCSEWRMQFLARAKHEGYKIDAVFVPKTEKPVTRNVIRVTVRVRKDRPLKPRVLCACGRRIVRPDHAQCYVCENPKTPMVFCKCGKEIRAKGREHCIHCLSRPIAAGLNPKCVVCEKPLFCTNKSGLCRKHARRGNGPRSTCKHQADGMRCTQILNRNNSTGLCRWHVSVHPIKIGSPRMEPCQ